MPKLTQITFQKEKDISLIKNKEILTLFKDFNPEIPLKVKCLKCNKEFERTFKLFKKFDYRCPLCEYEKSKENGLKITLKEFIKRSKDVHGELFDYSKVEYKSNNDLVTIICKFHNEEFKQKPAKHWLGQGCPKCRYIKSSLSLKQEPVDYFNKVKEIHNDLYIYNFNEFYNLDSLLNIVCKRCNNSFQLKARIHSINKVGCSACNHKVGGEKLRLNQKDFIDRCKEIHKDLCDYSKAIYTKGVDKIDVKCCKCNNIFAPTAHNHLYDKSGCPECAKTSSKEEKEIANFIKSIYIGNIIENSRNIISPFEIDIYVPDKNFAIEYNGLFWHTTDYIEKNKHETKTKRCANNDIKLFHIFSDEWINKSEIIKSMIKYRLGLVDQKIAARKCEFQILNKKEGEKFFNQSHISGNVQANIYLGLKYEDEIVCCLSLKKPIQKKYGENILEIARFANKLNTNVQGGFQKLFEKAKEHARNLNIVHILTYSDLRFGDGKVYELAGFKYLGETDLDYWYTDGTKREFRFKYRADKENGLTEKQVAENAGVQKIYGCGSKIWLYKL
jgi:predicted small secreted protein